MRRAQRETDPLFKLRFSEGDDVIELALQNVERQIEGIAGRESLGERADALHRHAFGSAPRACKGVGLLRLHADDARPLSESTSNDAASARAASAADRHENDVWLGQFLEDLR